MITRRLILGAAFAGLLSTQSFALAPPQVSHVDAASAQDLIDGVAELVVLDVRTKAEYERGHVEGAVQINYYSPTFRGHVRALDRSTPILVHCASGGRSNRSLKILKEEGFTKIFHLDGGYRALMAHRTAQSE